MSTRKGPLPRTRRSRPNWNELTTVDESGTTTLALCTMCDWRGGPYASKVEATIERRNHALDHDDVERYKPEAS